MPRMLRRRTRVIWLRREVTTPPAKSVESIRRRARDSRRGPSPVIFQPPRRPERQESKICSCAIGSFSVRQDPNQTASLHSLSFLAFLAVNGAEIETGIGVRRDTDPGSCVRPRPRWAESSTPALLLEFRLQPHAWAPGRRRHARRTVIFFGLASGDLASRTVSTPSL
jgi:hypothetical protein